MDEGTADNVLLEEIVDHVMAILPPYETSMYLYLDGDNVRTDLIKSGVISFNEEESPFNWVDLFSAGPATVVSWTSSYSDTGVLGDAELATPEKGRQAYEEAVKQLVRFVTRWKDRPKDVRKDRHRKPLYIGVPSVRIPKKWRITEIVKENAARLGELFVKYFKG